MKRSPRRFAEPALKCWAEHFTDHGEFFALPKEAVMAAPEGASFAKTLFQPWFRNQCQSIHFTEQFRASLGEAEPDRLLTVTQIALCFILVSPAFGPGQCGVAAVQPHLAAQ